MVWDDGDLRGVALHNGGESYFELRLDVTVSSFSDPRLLAPGNKVLVLVHTGHHVVHLLWSIPEHTVPWNTGTSNETVSPFQHRLVNLVLELVLNFYPNAQYFCNFFRFHYGFIYKWFSYLSILSTNCQKIAKNPESKVTSFNCSVCPTNSSKSKEM